MNTELATTSTSTAVTPWMIPETLKEAICIAKYLAESGMVPNHLENNVGGMVLIIQQAQMWNMSVLAVAQGTALVHGRLCFEGKLVNAALQSSGITKGPLDFDWTGKEGSEQYTVVVRGHLRSGIFKEVTGTVAGWKTTGKGSPWLNKTNHRKMLAYRGAREWARLWAPAVMAGVATRQDIDELHEAEVLEVRGSSFVQEVEAKIEEQVEEQPKPSSDEYHNLLNDLHAYNTSLAMEIDDDVRSDLLDEAQGTDQLRKALASYDKK